MKMIYIIIGVLLLLVGLVWFLQGINILPGSFMTGQPQWAIYGALAMLAGIGILVYGRRRGSPPPR